MRIQIASDIHLEGHLNYLPSPEYFTPVEDRDLLILAGDIGVNMLAERFVREQMEISPVIYVPGNHEYYTTRKRGDIDAAWKSIAKDSEYRLQYMVSDYTSIAPGFGVFGAPWYSDLWGDDTFRGQAFVRNGISDFQYWSLDDHIEQHKVQTSDMLHFKGNIDIMVTHWPPTTEAIHPRYTRDASSIRLNPYFVNDKEDLVREIGAKLWISGHTHESYDYQIGPTRCIGNPSGYRGESHLSSLFKPDKIVDVSL